MIVQPDFFDHWKTELLIELTGDPTAPIMVLRLWAYCQIKRTDRFENMTDAALRSICKSKLKPDRVRAVLMETGFIKQVESVMVVHDWANVNASMIASWRNGYHGGRPRKDETRGFSEPNPRKPKHNPPSLILSDKILSLERREAGFRLGFQKEAENLPTPDPDALKKFGAQLSQLTANLKSKTVDPSNP